MCSSSSSGRTSNEPNDPDYIPNLAMGYGDDSLALKLSLKKKARNKRRLRRSQAKDEKVKANPRIVRLIVYSLRRNYFPFNEAVRDIVPN